MKIDWEIFFGNSSTIEALCYFVLGGSFTDLNKRCWPKECKIAVKHLKHRGYLKSRRAAKRALRLRGFFPISPIEHLL